MVDTQVICTAGGHAISAPSGLVVAGGFLQIPTESSLHATSDIHELKIESVVEMLMSLRPRLYTTHPAEAERRPSLGFFADELPSQLTEKSLNALDLGALITALTTVVQKHEHFIQSLDHVREEQQSVKDG
jgi:hypothetical protein